MVTTKKIAIEYTQKAMRQGLKHFTTNNNKKLTTQEDSNAVNVGQGTYKVYRRQIAKWQQ